MKEMNTQTHFDPSLFTAIIMLVSVFLDLGVWYEAKTVVIFNTQKKEEDNLKMEPIDDQNDAMAI